jgi:hypothetical protein
MASVISEQAGLHKWSRIPEDCGPTEDLVDAALGKSEQLLGELAKLGISIDWDDSPSDASTSCPPSLCASGSCRSLLSDAGDCWTEDPLLDPDRALLSSPACAEMSEHVQSITKLLTLRKKLHKVKEQMERGETDMIKESSEAILRLEEHFQALSSVAQGNVHSNVESRLHKLEAEVCRLKEKSAVESVQPFRTSQRSARKSLPAMPARVFARSPSPVPAVRAGRASVAFRAASPTVRSAVSPSVQVRALSPPLPKRLVCQQVAVTNVYNFWSLQD